MDAEILYMFLCASDMGWDKSSNNSSLLHDELEQWPEMLRSETQEVCAAIGL